MNEHETTALLARLADDCPVSPPPVDAVVAGGQHRVQSRRRALTAAGAVTAIVIVTATSLGWRELQGSNATGPTSPSATTTSSSWKDMTDAALADALGLTPVPLAEVNQSVECSGDDGIIDKNVMVFKGNPNALVWCYLPSDYGITDPVEGELLKWQLFGVPRSPDLVELASLKVQEQRLANAPAATEDLIALGNKIDAVKKRLFPPDGNMSAWLKSHTEH